MRHLIWLATFLAITLAAPVIDEQSSSVSSDDNYFGWLNFLPKFRFFEDSTSTELASENVTSTGNEETVSSTTSSKASSVVEVFGNVTRQDLVRLYLETDRQLRYWRNVASMGVLSFYENFAGDSASQAIHNASADEKDPSLMATSLEAATQMAKLMSSFMQNGLAHLGDYFK